MSCSFVIGSSNSAAKKAKSSRVSSRVARPMSVSMNGGSSIGGAAGDGSREAFRKDELRMGRMELRLSQLASPWCANGPSS